MKTLSKIILLTSITIVGCSLNNNSLDESITDSSKIEADGMISDYYSRINEIKNTQEFVEFENRSKILRKKILEYTSKWDEEKFKEFEENQNCDEFIEEFVRNSDLEKDFLALSKAKSALVENTNLSRLSDTEMNLLLLQRTASIKRTKSSSEEAEEECERIREENYSWAKAKAEVGIIACACSAEVPLVACACYVVVMVNFADDIRQADQAYEECMKNAKNN